MKKILLLLCFCMVLHNVFSQDTLKVIEKIPEQKWGFAVASASMLFTKAILSKIDIYKKGISANPVEFVITSIAINIGKGGKVNAVYFPKNIPEKMSKWYETASIANGIKEIEPIKLIRFEGKTLLFTVIFTKFESEHIVPLSNLMNNMPIIWPDFIVENETEVIVLKPTRLVLGILSIN